jgi:TonB family protein
MRTALRPCFTILLLIIFAVVLSPAHAQKRPRNGKYIEKYPDGALKVQGTYKKHMKQGEWLWYYPSGTPKKKENYVDDVLEGTSTLYDNFNTQIWQANYKNGVLNGPCIMYDKGMGYTKGYYKNGVEDSVWQDLDYNFRIIAEGPMLNGKKEGTWKGYTSSGELKYEAFYKEGKEHGKYITYNYTGKKLSEHTYENGVRNGPYKVWNTYEQLKEEGNYSEGRKHGKVIEYLFGWGEGRIEATYEYGMKHGVCDTYHGNILSKRSEYEMDLLREEFDFYDNGKVRFESRYNEGKPDGEQLEYFESGKVKERSMYTKGKKEGKWITYYYPGDIIESEKNYADGVLHGTSIMWSRKGKKNSEMNYQDGYKHGKSTWYYPSGKIEEVENFDKGKPTGTWTAYYSSGIRKWEQKYDSKGKVLSYTEWDANGKKIDVLVQQQVIDEPIDGAWDDVVAPVEGPSVEEPTIYTVVQIMPEFPYGDLNQYIAKNITYPPYARDMGIEGTVYIQFVISSDGTVRDPKVLKAPANGVLLEKEALRVISALPKFKPGMMAGKPVNVYYNVPIKFQLK